MKRRSLIQVAGASGTGIATMGAVSAESENVVDFVNLQLVASPNEPVPDSVVTTSMPSVVGHYADPQRETLHLNKFISDEDRELLNREGKVFRASTYEQYPNQKATRKKRDWVPTDLHDDARVAGGLVVSERWLPRQFGIGQSEKHNRGVTVKSDNGRTEVPAQGVRAHQLPNRTVEVATVEPTGEMAENQLGEGQVEVVERGSMELEITPSIIAKNYGRLEVRDTKNDDYLM